MVTKRAILAFLFLVAAPCLVSGAETAVGKITYLEGRVDVTHSSQQEPVALAEGASVGIGDSLRTKSYSKVEVTFADGSKVRLAPSTRIEITDYRLDGKNKRLHAAVKVTRGRMRAMVSKTSSPDTFQLLTPNASGTVHGSDIFVSYQAGKTGFLVKDGQIAIANLALPDKKEEIVKGDYAVVPAKEPPTGLRFYLDAEFQLYRMDTEPPQAAKVVSRDKTKMDGVIAEMGGGVRVYKAGLAAWRYARLNETLSEGDKVETLEDGKAVIRLGNGNTLYLQPSSEITLTVLKQDPKTGEYENIFESKVGKIKAVVEKLGKNSTFRVKTPTALCGVRGTVMYLDIQPAVTAAFYEGGVGDVTNLVSGDSTVVESGQNAVANENGATTSPTITTDQQRLDMDTTWESGAAVEGSGLPQNNPGQEGMLPPPPPGSSEGGTTQGGGTTDSTPGDDVGGGLGPFIPPLPFDETPFSPPPPAPPAPPVTEDTSFIVRTGTVNTTVASFTPDLSSSVTGSFSHGSFGTPTWSGDPISGGITGTVVNPNSRNLLDGDLKGTLSDGGRYKGWVVGFTDPADSVRFKMATIYIDPSGRAGTLVGHFSGDGPSGSGAFATDAGNYSIDEMQTVSIPAGNLFTTSFVSGAIAGSGSGRDLFGASITCGVNHLTGETQHLPGYDGWGIWKIALSGSYNQTPVGSWSIGCGGTNDIADPGYWLATAHGTVWTPGHAIEGTFKGIWLSQKGGSGEIVAGLIEQGDIFGVDISSQFQAVGAGVWNKVTESFTPAGLGYNMTNLQTFVSVPITEAFHYSPTGSNANLVASSGTSLSFYTSPAGTVNNIWAASIMGTYTSNPTTPWILDISAPSGTGSVTMYLTAGTWSGGQWHATVTGDNTNPGITAGDVLTFTGEAGGTYGQAAGEFEGAASGTWIEYP